MFVTVIINYIVCNRKINCFRRNRYCFRWCFICNIVAVRESNYYIIYTDIRNFSQVSFCTLLTVCYCIFTVIIRCVNRHTRFVRLSVIYPAFIRCKVTRLRTYCKFIIIIISDWIHYIIIKCNFYRINICIGRIFYSFTLWISICNFISNICGIGRNSCLMTVSVICKRCICYRKVYIFTYDFNCTFVIYRFIVRVCCMHPCSIYTAWNRHIGCVFTAVSAILNNISCRRRCYRYVSCRKRVR